MQWLLHLFAAVETSKIMHALRLHKSFGDSCLHSNLSQNLHNCMDKYMQWGINKHIRILFAELSGKQAYAFRGVAMPLYAFLLFLSTFLCAHPCCTPARPRAENNPIWVHYACIAIAILLPLALFFVRIPTVFQHGLRALLLCSST